MGQLRMALGASKQTNVWLVVLKLNRERPNFNSYWPAIKFKYRDVSGKKFQLTMFTRRISISLRIEVLTKKIAKRLLTDARYCHNVMRRND